MVHNLELKQGWTIEARFHKEYATSGLHMGPIPFGCLGFFNFY